MVGRASTGPPRVRFELVIIRAGHGDETGIVKRQLPLIRNRLRVPADDVKRLLVSMRARVDHGWDQSPVPLNDSVDAVFVWIPKNAGTSIWRMLVDHGLQTHSSMHRVRYGFQERGLVGFGHMDYLQLVRRGEVSREFHDRAFKFAVVRNPFDRTVSLFAYLRDANRLDRSLDFRGFVHRLQSRPVPEIGLYKERGLSFCNPQSRWLIDADGTLGVDLLGRVEDLADFTSRVSERLGIALEPPPHENRSERATHYRDYYDRETRTAVERLFAEDLDRFGYAF